MPNKHLPKKNPILGISVAYWQFYKIRNFQTGLSILFRHKPEAAPGSCIFIGGSIVADDAHSRQELLLRLLSAAELPHHNPVICREPGGRPFLQNGSQSYPLSLSHTRGVLLIALSTGPEIGLDAERADRRVPDRLQARIRSLARPDAETSIPTLTLWTLKEAFLKMTGTGLRHPMNLLDVSRTGPHHYFCTTADAFGTSISARIISFMWREFRISLAVREP